MNRTFLLLACLGVFTLLGLALLVQDEGGGGPRATPDPIDRSAGSPVLRGPPESGRAIETDDSTAEHLDPGDSYGVRGRVFDSSGAPVPGATIEILGRASARIRWRNAPSIARTTAAGNGDWSTVVDVSLGEVSVGAHHAEVGRSVPVVLEVQPEARGAEPIELVLIPGGDVLVRVVTPGDRVPVAGVVVGFTTGSDVRSAPCGEGATTNAGGECLLEDVPLPATLFVRGPGGGSTGRFIRSIPADVPLVELTFPRGAESSTVTLRSGDPEQVGREVLCVLQHDGGDWMFYQRFVAVVGGSPASVSTFSSAPSASLDLSAPSLGGRLELDWTGFRELLPGDVVIPVDRMVQQHLRFVSEEDGTPLPGLTYELVTKRSGIGVSAKASVVTDARGAGSAWIPDGDYDVSFAGNVIASLAVTVGGGEVETIPVSGFGTLGVEVVLPDDPGPLRMRVSSSEHPSDAGAFDPSRAAVAGRPPSLYTREWPLEGSAWSQLVPWPPGTELDVAVIAAEGGQPLVSTKAVVGRSPVRLDASRLRMPDVSVRVRLSRNGRPVVSGQVWLRDPTRYPQDSGGEPDDETKAPFSHRADIDPLSAVAEVRAAPHSSYSVYYRPAGVTPMDMVLGTKGGLLPEETIRVAESIRVEEQAVELQLTVQ